MGDIALWGVLALSALKSAAIMLSVARTIRLGADLVTLVRDTHPDQRRRATQFRRLSPVDGLLAALRPAIVRRPLVFVFRGYSVVTLSAALLLAVGDNESVSSGLMLATGLSLGICTMLLLLVAILRQLVFGPDEWRTPDVALPRFHFMAHWAVRTKPGSNSSIYFLVLVYLAVAGFAGLYSSLNAVSESAFAGVGDPTPITWIYFSMTTIATIGFGDISPSTGAAQAIVACQIATGPLLLSWLIAVLFTASRAE